MLQEPKRKKVRRVRGIAKPQRKVAKMDTARPFSKGPNKPEPDDKPKRMSMGSTNRNTGHISRLEKKLKNTLI